MSSVKPLCKSTELNRCMATDRRWKRKQVSRSSPERLPNVRPSSPRNSRDEELRTNCDTSQPFALLPFSLPPHTSCCSVHIRLSQCAYNGHVPNQQLRLPPCCGLELVRQVVCRPACSNLKVYYY